MKERVGKLPFVGCFRTKDNNYVYDVNSNDILRLEDREFELLTAALNDPDNASSYLKDDSIRLLRREGYLQSHRPEAITRPCRDCIEKQLEHGIGHVTLELTQDCNQRCTYCPYSCSEVNRRSHSARTMEWTTARAGIDYLHAHSGESEKPALGFYGGEPLLEWDLLHRCLGYACRRTDPANLHFSLSTNATLITDEIAEVLARYGVAVLVSLDGPEEIHNRMRHLVGDHKGGYTRTLKGLGRLRRAYGRDALVRVMLNAVTGPWTDFSRLREYFSDSGPDEIKGLSFRVSPASHTGIDKLWETSTGRTQSVACETEQALARAWHDALAENDYDRGSGENFLRRMFEPAHLRFHKRPKTTLGQYLGPMGTCVPGIRKSYINVDGDILPCERVPERYQIGNILKGGIDPGKCEALLDQVVAMFGHRCLDCVFCRICAGCPASYCDDEGNVTEESIERHCTRQSRFLGNLLLEYVGLIERNPRCLDYMETIVIS